MCARVAGSAPARLGKGSPLSSGSEHRWVDVGKITIPKGGRQSRNVEDLAASIKDLGFLINPITVTSENVLVAGRRRLAAVRLLGWDKVSAIVIPPEKLKQRLTEIDENLQRQELTPLELGEHLAERKDLYLALYPETKPVRERGGPGRGKKTAEKISPVSPFTSDTAKKTGKTPRAVRNEVRIGEQIPENVRNTIRETPIAQKQSELLKLARMEEDEQEAVAEVIASGKAKGVKQAQNIIKAAEMNAKPLPLPEGPFDVIVADPPWSYDNRAEDAAHRAANPYPSMPISEICAYWQTEGLESRAGTNCILWLWTTNAHMREAFSVLDAWGFTHKTILTWVKDRMGTGDWLRGRTEHCLLAVRGKPTVVLGNQTTAIEGPLRQHSRKPDEFYRLVEELCPGSRLELFSRTEREGWTSHGAERGYIS